MDRNIRPVLWLESSFFHAPCQATSYAAPSTRDRLPSPSRQERPEALAKRLPMQEAPPEISVAAALKLRKRLTDNPANGEERSDPGSGVGGPSFRRGIEAIPPVRSEEDARRAQWASRSCGRSLARERP